MIACVCNEYGPASQVFQVRHDMDKPTLDNNETQTQVLIANRFTTVNPADCKQRSGNLKLVAKHKFPLILGQDFAGVVVQVGSKVSKVQVGDEVFGSTAPRNGCAASFVCAYEQECTSKPKNVSWEAAVAAPTSYCTAWRGLFEKDYGNLELKNNNDDTTTTSSTKESKPKTKRTVLIVGASGSVGSSAVQLAVTFATHTEIVAICGSKNMDYVKSLGATHVLDYAQDYVSQIKALDQRFDLILDCVGGDHYYYSLRPFLKEELASAVYVTCVGPVLHGGSEPITYGTLAKTVGTLVPRLLGNYFPSKRWNSRYKMYLDFTTANGVLDQIAKGLEDGRLSPRIDSTISPLPLEDLAKGHEKVESGHSDGKVVVQIGAKEGK